jgi:hypothetical protein
VNVGAILHGRQERGLEGGDLLGVQSDPLPFVLVVEAYQGMCKPALEVLLRGLLDVVAGVPQEPVA